MDSEFTIRFLIPIGGHDPEVWQRISMVQVEVVLIKYQSNLMGDLMKAEEKWLLNCFG